MIKKTVMELTSGKLGISMWDNFKMIIGMGMGKCFGETVNHTKESGQMEYK